MWRIGSQTPPSRMMIPCDVPALGLTGTVVGTTVVWAPVVIAALPAACAPLGSEDPATSAAAASRAAASGRERRTAVTAVGMSPSPLLGTPPVCRRAIEEEDAALPVPFPRAYVRCGTAGPPPSRLLATAPQPVRAGGRAFQVRARSPGA